MYKRTVYESNVDPYPSVTFEIWAIKKKLCPIKLKVYVRERVIRKVVFYR